MVGVAGFDQKDEHDRHHCGGSEDAEDPKKRNMPVAQDSKAPIRKPTAADADQVHDAIPGGAQLRAGDLAEDGHVIRVEEAPSQPEKDKECHSHPEVTGLRRVTDTKHRWHDERHADCTDKDASALISS